MGRRLSEFDFASLGRADPPCWLQRREGFAPTGSQDGSVSATGAMVGLGMVMDEANVSAGLPTVMAWPVELVLESECDADAVDPLLLVTPTDVCSRRMGSGSDGGGVSKLTLFVPLP